MKSLQDTARVFRRLMGLRTLARRRVRRGRWGTEVLEARTLLTMPAYVLQTGSDSPLDGLEITLWETYESHPVLVDFDGDDDLDLVLGRHSGISYFENEGDASAPNFVARTGAENPFASFESGSLFNPAPALADWDADGDLDLLLATYLGELTAYENTGNAADPSFTLLGPGNPFEGLYTQNAIYPSPAFADMDGDGDQDLSVSGRTARISYFENIGSSTSPDYEPVTEGDPFSNVSLFVFASISLGDVDSDGDVDLVAGSYPGGFQFFENTGSATQANLTEVTEVFNNQFSGSYLFVPALGDLDNDGDQDLLVAPTFGLRSYEAIVNPATYTPKNTVPFYQIAREDVATDFSVAGGDAISVADPNSDGSDLQVTLSVDHGQLTLATTSGLTFVSGDGISDSNLTFRGSVAEINAALDGLSFQPAVDFSGVASLTITTNDLGQPGGGAAASDLDSVPITVLSVAAQVEQLKTLIRYYKEFAGVNRGASEALQRVLTLKGNPVADARALKTFTTLVQSFARTGILFEDIDLVLLELAQDILIGVNTFR